MLKRYSRNVSTLSVEESESLVQNRVCVIGCGGLGGYIIEMLGRLGVGHITAIDGDVFEETNLNRQLLSDTESLGMNKALKAKNRMKVVNPHIEVTAITEKLTEVNGREILKGMDVVVDALDSIETRLLLEELCMELNIPMVHGAIAGWYGQVATILPGDKVLRNYYTGKDLVGAEKVYGNPSFTPALVASIQVSEVVKLLIGRGDLLRRKMLFIDLYRQEYDTIDFDRG
ncbi:MAG: HesA/MoeB/ThiF family protein [Bacillota bacterium]